MSPREILNQYLALSDEERTEFLKLLAGELRGEAIFGMSAELSVGEQERFQELFFHEVADWFFAFALQKAREVAKESRDVSDEEFDNELLERIGKATAMFTREIGEREAAKLKAQRDRKSDPKTIRRNVQICALRRKDKRYWSQGRLAKKFGLETTRAIRLILQEEAKWRRLASELGETSN